MAFFGDPAMPHRRSREKLQMREIRRIIFSKSVYDREAAETVCRVSRLDVLHMLKEPLEVHLVPDVEKGEVLIDSRGQGSFQRVHDEIVKRTFESQVE
jgi:hypothetical protein